MRFPTGSWLRTHGNVSASSFESHRLATETLATSERLKRSPGVWSRQSARCCVA